MSNPPPLEEPLDDATWLDAQLPARSPDPLLRLLLRGFQQGNLEAFGVFYDLTYPTVHHYLYFRTNDRKIAWELINATYFQARAHVKEFLATHLSAEAWIMRIARRLATSRLKQPFGLAVVAFDTDLERVLTDLDAHNPDLDQELQVLLALKELKQVLQALRRLGPLQQECVVLRSILQFDAATVGEILGLNSSEIITLYWQATKAVRKILHRPPDLQYR